MNTKQQVATGVLAMIIVASVAFMPVNAGVKDPPISAQRHSGMIAFSSGHHRRAAARPGSRPHLQLIVFPARRTCERPPVSPAGIFYFMRMPGIAPESGASR